MSTMKHIKTYEQFLNEDAVDSTQDQINKATKRASRFDNKAATARYDIKFKQDKLEYEKKKDAYQQDIKDAKDGVQKETEKAALRGLQDQWKETKQKYKDRLSSMRKSSTAS
jgi:hypothetical protein